jgi:hypothetical protein
VRIAARQSEHHMYSCAGLDSAESSARVASLSGVKRVSSGRDGGAPRGGRELESFDMAKRV